MSLTRRDVLKAAALGTSGAILPAVVLAQSTASRVGLAGSRRQGRASLASPPTVPAAQVETTWQLGADTEALIFDDEDVDTGIIREGDSLWVIYSNGANQVRRFRGPDIDHLNTLPDGQLDPSFSQPHGDDRYWLSGLWSDGSTWYATVHVEFNYNSIPVGFNWFRRIGLATSTDQGANWHYVGDIITSPNPTDIGGYPGAYYDFGDGDQKLFVDYAGGYFYVYFMTAWVYKATGVRTETMRVARCPIDAKMAPGAWRKWYQDSWSQPGLGGFDSDVFPDEDSSTVFYSTYLRRYVAVGNYGSFLALATDLNTQNWTPRVSFAPGRLIWYNWAFDPATDSKMTVGQNFRIYSADAGAESGLAPTKYMSVTFGPGTTTTPGFMPVYTDESVPDGNPGWQRAYGGAYAQTYTNDFSGALQGWRTVLRQNAAAWLSGDGALTGVSHGPGELWGVDENAPQTADGDLTFIVIPRRAQSFGVLLRYSSSSSYLLLACERGWFSYRTPAGQGALFPLTFEEGTAHTIEVGFTGRQLTVTVDATQRYNGTLAPAMLPTSAGAFGFAVWGESLTTFDTAVLAYGDPS